LAWHINGSGVARQSGGMKTNNETAHKHGGGSINMAAKSNHRVCKQRRRLNKI